MASVNRVILIGNLTKDPEIRYLASGDAVTSTSIACNETWKGKDGQKQERVEYVNLVFFRKLGEIAGEYLKKGAPVYVEGKLQTDKYTDKQGVERYTTKVVVDQMQMLGGKASGESRQSEPRQQPEKKFEGGGDPYRSKKPGGFDDMDDDIPF